MMRECEDIEMSYQKIKRMAQSFYTGVSFCKDEESNLMMDEKSTLEIWKNHFNKALNAIY